MAKRTAPVTLTNNSWTALTANEKNVKIQHIGWGYSQYIIADSIGDIGPTDEGTTVFQDGIFEPSLAVTGTAPIVFGKNITGPGLIMVTKF